MPPLKGRHPRKWHNFIPNGFLTIPHTTPNRSPTPLKTVPPRKNNPPEAPVAPPDPQGHPPHPHRMYVNAQTHNVKAHMCALTYYVKAHVGNLTLTTSDKLSSDVDNFL